MENTFKKNISRTYIQVFEVKTADTVKPVLSSHKRETQKVAT